MLKVLKFGGSSLADAHQFAKVKSIVDADPARRVVIVSAPGKRFSGDHKITDLLYLCAAHIKYGVSCEDIFAMIRDRYNEIIAECGLHISLDKEFDALWDKMKNGISQDELASRGEYFSARLMAEFLGFEFLDAALWLQFAVFLIVSILALIATRPLARKMLDKTIVPTNADRVLHHEAKVTETVDNENATGAVYIDGKTWTARSEDGNIIPKGKMARIVRMEGVKLYVRESKEPSERRE